MKNIITTVFVVAFLSLSLLSQEIKPKSTIQFKGTIEDFIVDNNYLYAVGDEGKLFCLSLKSKKIVKTLSLPTIKDFMGDMINAKIQCVDKNPDKDEIIVVSQGMRGYRNVYLIENWKSRLIIEDVKFKWMIKEICL